jgi:hypothetical protein
MCCFRSTPVSLVEVLLRYISVAFVLNLLVALCCTVAQARPLSCASLLAFGGSTRTAYKWKNGHRVESITTSVSSTSCSRMGCLWLVDETGAYPVRAHCMGGGMTETQRDESDSNSKHESVADIVNRRLQKLWRIHQQSTEDPLPYFDVTTSEGMHILLDLLSPPNGSKNVVKTSQSEEVLQSRSRLELAVIDANERRIRRSRLCDVWKTRASSPPFTIC